jgi:feruloyl esterase
LTRFRDRGGKIIITHGLADQLIPADGTINYYKRVLQRMGGSEEVGRFARLFLAPGVDHGFRGPGATPVGRMEAILRWVEEGAPPDKLMAEHRDAGGKVIRTRPLFPYPQVARYKGSGSSDEAENFVSSSPAD